MTLHTHTHTHTRTHTTQPMTAVFVNERKDKNSVALYWVQDPIKLYVHLCQSECIFCGSAINTHIIHA